MTFLLIVTVTSMLLAAIMSAVAWRLATDERRRSDARVAALAVEIHAADAGELAGAPDPRRPWDASSIQVRQVPASGDLFAAPPRRSTSRPFAIAGAGALVFGAALAIAILSGRGFNGAPVAARSSSALPVAEAAPAAARPLELVALAHERVGDQLTVRGVVRNPPSGAGLDRLTAVVLVFTPDGGFVASGRAPVETAALGPGRKSTFAVTLPHAADVARYRVSFRSGDHLVSHMDRRHEG